MGKTNKNSILEEILRTDFSLEGSNKEKILSKLLLNIGKGKCVDDGKESFAMKKTFRKPILASALLIVFVMGFAMTSYGQEFYRIIKEVFVGEHAKYVVEEQTGTPELTVPDELKGKLYDKNGNMLEQFSEDMEIYNQSGELVFLSVMVRGDGTEDLAAMTQKEYDERQNSRMTAMTDLEEAKSYLAFDFSLPGYLPQGYAFDRIQLFNDESGKPVKNCEYAYVYFSNTDHSNEIYLQLRLMNNETVYEASIGNVEEVEINGNKGVVGEGFLDVEIDGVMYILRAKASGIDTDQLIKIAKSI